MSLDELFRVQDKNQKPLCVSLTKTKKDINYKNLDAYIKSLKELDKQKKGSHH